MSVSQQNKGKSRKKILATARIFITLANFHCQFQ